MYRSFTVALCAALPLFFLAACGVSPSGENAAVTVGATPGTAFADYSTSVTATATVQRNGLAWAGAPVDFTVSPEVTLLTPTTGLSTDLNGRVSVRFKRFPFFSNSSTATVSARTGSTVSTPVRVTFTRPAVGTNLLAVSPDPALARRFLFQGFGLGSATGPGVGGMDVTIAYTGSVNPPTVAESATDLFGGTLFVDTSTPGLVHLLGVSFDPLPAQGSFATITFDAASAPVITGITVNSFTDASPSTIALPTRIAIRNP